MAMKSFSLLRVSTEKGELSHEEDYGPVTWPFPRPRHRLRFRAGYRLGLHRRHHRQGQEAQEEQEVEDQRRGDGLRHQQHQRHEVTFVLLDFLSRMAWAVPRVMRDCRFQEA